LRLYDVVHSIGVATDLNHIDTACKVSGYLPENDGLKNALSGADIVVIPAGILQLCAISIKITHVDLGIARKPGMTRDGRLYFLKCLPKDTNLQ
jgi:malate dehydrogenase